jgi:hypothetical protein
MPGSTERPLSPKTAALIFLIPLSPLAAVSTWRLNASDGGPIASRLLVIEAAIVIAALLAAMMQARRPAGRRTLVVRHTLLGLISGTGALILIPVMEPNRMDLFLAATAVYTMTVVLALSTIFTVRVVDQWIRDNRVRAALRERLTESAEIARHVDAAHARRNKLMVERIKEAVEYPLRELHKRIHSMEPEAAALALEDLLARRARPLSHALHPMTSKNGPQTIDELVATVWVTDSAADDEPRRLDKTPEWVDDQLHYLVKDLVLIHRVDRMVIDLKRKEIMLTGGTIHEVNTHDHAMPRWELSPRPAARSAVIRARKSAPTTEFALTPEATKVRILQALTTAPLFDPRIAVLISLLILPRHIALAARNVELLQALAAAASAAVVAVAMTVLFARLVKSDLPITVPAALTVVALHALIGVSAGLAFNAVAFDRAGEDQSFLFADVGLGMIVRSLAGIGALVVSSLRVQLHRQQKLLEEIEAERAERASRARMASQLADEHTANLLHRTVQGRMAAIVLLLRTGRITAAHHHLNQLVDVDLPHTLSAVAAGATTAESNVADTRQLWRLDLPIIVTESIHPDVRAALRREFLDDLAGITTEAGVNALRHGGARHMRVTLRTEGSNVILECRNDGRALNNQDWKPGLGCAVFDDFARTHWATWSLSGDPAVGTTFRMVIPTEVALRDEDSMTTLEPQLPTQRPASDLADARSLQE